MNEDIGLPNGFISVLYLMDSLSAEHLSIIMQASDGCSGAALIAKSSDTTLATGSYIANMCYTACGSIGKATKSNALNGARNTSRTTSPTLYGQMSLLFS